MWRWLWHMFVLRYMYLQGIIVVHWSLWYEPAYRRERKCVREYVREVERTSKFPPDPIHDLCSLPNCHISWRYFEYRSVQILKICSEGSDPPRKTMRYWFYYSTWLNVNFHQTKMFRRKRIVPIRYQHWGIHRTGLPFNIFAFFIGAGGCTEQNDLRGMQSLWEQKERL